MSVVNDQITDAVTQVNTLLTGSSPSQSAGMLGITGAETLGMSMFNAITAQQNSQTSASAAATASCARILQADVAAPPPPPNSKEQLATALLKIELKEQQTALTMASLILRELYINSGTKLTTTQITTTLENAIANAGTKLASLKIDKALLVSAGTVLVENFDSTTKKLSGAKH